MRYSKLIPGGMIFNPRRTDVTVIPQNGRDFNPLHFDDGYAKQHGLDARIVSMVHMFAAMDLTRNIAGANWSDAPLKTGEKPYLSLDGALVRYQGGEEKRLFLQSVELSTREMFYPNERMTAKLGKWMKKNNDYGPQYVLSVVLESKSGGAKPAAVTRFYFGERQPVYTEMPLDKPQDEENQVESKPEVVMPYDHDTFSSFTQAIHLSNSMVMEPSMRDKSIDGVVLPSIMISAAFGHLWQSVSSTSVVQATKGELAGKKIDTSGKMFLNSGMKVDFYGFGGFIYPSSDAAHDIYAQTGKNEVVSKNHGNLLVAKTPVEVSLEHLIARVHPVVHIDVTGAEPVE